MNTKTIAVLLVGLGIVVLAYSGLTFTTPGKPVNFLGMHFETTESHFIPPVVGALALVGGIALLLRESEAGRMSTINASAGWVVFREQPQLLISSAKGRSA